MRNLLLYGGAWMFIAAITLSLGACKPSHSTSTQQVETENTQSIHNKEKNVTEQDAIRIAEAAVRKHLKDDRLVLESNATEHSDGWRVLVQRLPAKPGAHSVVILSKSGEIKEIRAGH